MATVTIFLDNWNGLSCQLSRNSSWGLFGLRLVLSFWSSRIGPSSYLFSTWQSPSKLDSAHLAYRKGSASYWDSKRKLKRVFSRLLEPAYRTSLKLAMPKSPHQNGVHKIFASHSLTWNILTPLEAKIEWKKIPQKVDSLPRDYRIWIWMMKMDS